ncbi:MAG: chloramphenicol phosphotransferase CPT family protein [Oscillospiraceae bacterium]|nr:chloramphenicol phosphotransferase CPT family protein [Oscillospiraceae bacterium]
MDKGKIIYLEGVSSSGKTTLARTLQTRLPEPFFLLSGDMFWEMSPNNGIKPTIYESNVIFSKVDLITRNTLKLFSDLGIDFIIDFVPVRGGFTKILYENPVLYVNVFCPIEELRRREKERGDRQIGLAESQLDEMFPQAEYDITVDTFNNTPEECADKIIELLDYPEKFTAFRNLWAQCSK